MEKRLNLTWVESLKTSSLDDHLQFNNKNCSIFMLHGGYVATILYTLNPIIVFNITPKMNMIFIVMNPLQMTNVTLHNLKF